MLAPARRQTPESASLASPDIVNANDIPATVRIPKVIHQIWLGDQARRPARWMSSWQQKHPDWEYRLWTEANLPPLRAQAAFDAMPHLAGKADILRYELLHRFGGVYIDADAECVASLSDDLLSNRAFAAHENEYVRPGMIANGVIGCLPGTPLMAAMTDTILATEGLRECPAIEVWKLTGPLAFTRVIGRGGHSYIRIYPSFWFYPEHYSGVHYSGVVDRCYARQYWGSTRSGVYEANAQ